MTFTLDDVARVAKGLEADECAILNVAFELGKDQTILGGIPGMARGNTLNGMRDKGLLANGKLWRGHQTYSATPLGLSVKAYLQEHPNA